MISTPDWLSRRTRPNPSPYELSQAERYARHRRLIYKIQPFSDPKREAEYQRHAPERARVRWL